MDPRTEPVSLSNALFSKVQQRVLGLVFAHPERSFYTQEIIRSVDSGVGAVERELSRLHRSGLVSVERIGKQKHYRANRNAPIFEELHGLVLKTVALSEVLKAALAPHADMIVAAFVFGSVAKGTDTAESDIDLMVIGDDLDLSTLYSAFEDAGSRLLRKVSPMFMTPEDWGRKAAQRGSFVQQLNTSPRIFLSGSESDLLA